MKAFATLLLSLLVTAAPLTTEAVAADVPSANEITIVSVSTSGNGCPQGTVETSISLDRTIVTFRFGDFLAYIGPGIAAVDRAKNCQIYLNLRYPSGFNFAVRESTYHGYAQLESGVTGTLLSTYFFSQAPSETSTTRITITGGGSWTYGQGYTKTDTLPTTALIFCPCDSNHILNINNRIVLVSTDRKASGEISSEDFFGSTHQVKLHWQRCK